MKFRTIPRAPSIKQYNALRNLAGWPTFHEKLVEEALRNSLYVFRVLDENETLVGMGRVIGDNAIYLHIQDVVVHPAYQRGGIGKINNA
jgi:ribosomal protein S18 acetylase RimI-like enzyme